MCTFIMQNTFLKALDIVNKKLSGLLDKCYLKYLSTQFCLRIPLETPMWERYESKSFIGIVLVKSLVVDRSQSLSHLALGSHVKNSHNNHCDRIIAFWCDITDSSRLCLYHSQTTMYRSYNHNFFTLKIELFSPWLTSQIFQPNIYVVNWHRSRPLNKLYGKKKTELYFSIFYFLITKIFRLWFIIRCKLLNFPELEVYDCIQYKTLIGNTLPNTAFQVCLLCY